MASLTMIRRRWYQWTVLAAAVGLAAIAVVATVALYRLNQTGNEMGFVTVADSLASLEGGGIGTEPVNVLVVGFENDSNLAPNDPLRAPVLNARRWVSTAIVVRIDPTQQSLSILALPADLALQAPSNGGSLALGGLQAVGGAKLTIDAVSTTLEIPLHHYIELETSSLDSVVDAIGGVPVYLPFPMRDSTIGLQLEDTGCVVLQGAAVESYVEAPELEGITPETGDWELLSLTGNYQGVDRDADLLVSALRKVDIGYNSIRGLGSAIARSVAVDELLTRRDAARLLDEAHQFQETSMFVFELPVVNSGSGDRSGLATYVEGLESSAILDVFRGVSDEGQTHAKRPGTAGLRSVTCRFD